MSLLYKIFAGRKPPQDDLQQRSRDAPAAVDADGTEISKITFIPPFKSRPRPIWVSRHLW